MCRFARTALTTQSPQSRVHLPLRLSDRWEISDAEQDDGRESSGPSLFAPCRDGLRVMERRVFVRIVTGVLVLVVPFGPRAQTGTTIRRIGWLGFGAPTPPAVLEERNALLRELGWIEGQNLLIERRFANGNAELLDPLAEELVRLKVELIVAEGTNVTMAAKKATTATPILMWSAGDPVGTGLVASLARPGSNVTGYSLLSPETDVKRLSLLRELLPAAQRVGELENSTNPLFRAKRKGLEQAYRSVGMQPFFIEIARASELEDAIADVTRKRAQVLHVPNDDLFEDNVSGIMGAASRHALPPIADRVHVFLEAGALLSYGFSVAELQRRGAAFIDKILRGAKPGDLPVEQPRQFELGINLKTAKTLGITVPQALVLRADRVIQ